MKTITSAAANKMIKALDDEKNYYFQLEQEASVYIMAEGEHTEPPVYDYEDIQSRITGADHKIRCIKHAINLFNTTTVLEEVGITIDEALVEMAQLNRMKQRLDSMRKRLPKKRNSDMVFGAARNMIEYEYVNYDLEKVMADYAAVCERISTIQMALDLANQTRTFELMLE